LFLTDKLNGESYATLLLFGPAELMVETADNLPPGSAFTLTSETDPAPCGDLARPGVLVQAPSNSLTLLRVNGIDLAINGTAVIQAPNGGGLTVSALTRETILGQSGTVVFAGYSAQVDGEGNVEVAPYDPANVAHLPTEILPQMELVPLPGSGTVREETVLHLRPDASAYTGTQVKLAVPVSLFGRDASGEWLYIRSYDGATGWVPASALDVDGAGDMPILEASGLPTLQRPLRPFGEVQARGVTTAESNNLRDGPGQNYEIVQAVPLGTELNIYARSPEDEWFLVETTDGVRAWISVSIVNPVTPLNIAELPYSPDFPG
jgi:SH3-like domain-containing protein